LRLRNSSSKKSTALTGLKESIQIASKIDGVTALDPKQVRWSPLAAVKEGKPPRILAVEHHDAPSLGVVGETLVAEGVEIEVIWGEDGDPIPKYTDDYAGMVVLGGTMNALDDERSSYFPNLVSLIRKFNEQDQPVMGICLGAQLIARAFGADSNLDGSFEFGFHPVDLTTQGKKDEVVGHMGNSFHVFEWHTDHYTLPQNAVRLIEGRAYPNQAFRIGRATYGMQFHLEATTELIEGWISNNPDLNERAPGFEEWLPLQFTSHVAPANAFCRELTRRWLRLCN